MGEKQRRIQLRVSEDFYNRVDKWREKWGWTMSVAVSYMLSEQMNFLEGHRYKKPADNPYTDTKNEDQEEFNQDVPQSALLKSMGFKKKKQ